MGKGVGRISSLSYSANCGSVVSQNLHESITKISPFCEQQPYSNDSSYQFEKFTVGVIKNTPSAVNFAILYKYSKVILNSIFFLF